ncbi:MAG: DNA mismatch repair endonuclease MutL [Prevotella sp.]|nr:DNA mismatch repair endonuclease MutL [Prevotella sp.]
MSDIIQLLPDSVANQIAAGEVIQRPASVIKELMENAIDAGASNIRVMVVDAGRTSIQVIDDGCGMSETDARLAFERHATSKIRQADDLFALHTMGFRGEALPSIAAVSQVVLTTRTADDEIGTCLTLQGSRVVAQEPVACPVGCNFRVDNLFFNVPARRKFLKTNATELNNILTAFERIVLVYPNVNFIFYSNQQELLNLRAGSLRQRIVDVFGKKLSQGLLPVEVDTPLCRITGFVGKPETARKKGSQEYFFANGRYMRHPYFHRAVVTAFERLVPEGMLPTYFIYFDVSPADVDVNIHPTKTEIKFENEQSIFQILSAAVKDAIGRFCEVPTIDFDVEGRPDIPVLDPQKDVTRVPQVQYSPSYNPFDTPSPGRARSMSSEDVLEMLAATKTHAEVQSPSLFDDEPAPVIAEMSPTHYQYKGQYIMTAVKSGLMIIDQHRADVRICFERNMERFSRGQHNIQRLLFPEMVQFSPSDNVMMQRFLPDLSVMGFDISDLGGGSYAIGGIPAGLEGVDPGSLLRNIVTDAASRGVSSDEELHTSLALGMARNTAIVYGQVLSNAEMERVVNELFSCSNANYTPDGRPILCILEQRDIEQLLG